MIEEEPREVATSIPGSFTFLVGACVGIAGPRWPFGVMMWLLALGLVLMLSNGLVSVGFVIV